MAKQIIIFLTVLFIASSNFIFEVNNYGFYKIKQSFPNGKLTIVNKTGLFFQNFGKITDYKISDEQNFKNLVEIRFNDGSTAKIDGILKYRLSLKEENQLKLHRDYRSYENIKEQLIKQTVIESLLQTAPLFTAEEVYTSRRAEFSTFAEEQITKGLFETSTKQIKEKNVNGGEFIRNSTVINTDEDGNYKVRKKSPFEEYGIEVVQFSITNIDFDSSIEDLITKKKKAEQERVVAQSTAEKAKQDALTIIEQGKAEIAKAEAKALIEQKTAIINAEKERKVAEENAKKAIAEAKIIKERGEAEAYANKLKVQAGLTPLEKANIEKETSIGIARELSKIKFPELMIIGGDKNNLNPFDAVGLNSFIDITNKIKNNK